MNVFIIGTYCTRTLYNVNWFGKLFRSRIMLSLLISFTVKLESSGYLSVVNSTTNSFPPLPSQLETSTGDGGFGTDVGVGLSPPPPPLHNIEFLSLLSFNVSQVVVVIQSARVLVREYTPG
jgi:hypothetical protein